MSLRTHAVIVQPDRYQGAPADLARLLAPITGTDLAPLTEALARGPMTVEADLSAADAVALASRLSNLGVPAEVQPPASDVVSGTDDAAAPGAIEAERARVTDEVPRQRSRTMLGMNPTATEKPAQASDGWASVFPDLKPENESSARPRHTPAPPIPVEPAEPAAHEQEATPPPLDLLEAPVEKTPPLGSGAIAAAPRPEPDPPDRAAVDTIAAPPTPDAAPAAQPVAAQPVAPESPPAQPQSTGAPSARKKRNPTKPSGFDPTKLSGLMPADAEPEKQAPYKPRGFDPRPEHHPPFAVAFALLAPGAGHVFNGDDEEGLALGLRFWMIVPWVRSISEVRDQAEKIRTHWAPRPEDGSGFRAFRYAAGWWLSVVLIAAILAWGVPTLLRLNDREPEQVGPTPEAIVATFESANTRVLGARVKALDALQFAQKDLEPTPKYSMTEEERAERLYSIGYHECSRRGYSMCEQMMKRILELRPAFSPAIRLQAWASLAQRGGVKEPLPDVGVVPSLNELELQEWRQEMVLQGEHVPPPRKDDEQHPDGLQPDEQVSDGLQPDDQPGEQAPDDPTAAPDESPDGTGTNQ